MQRRWASTSAKVALQGSKMTRKRRVLLPKTTLRSEWWWTSLKTYAKLSMKTKQQSKEMKDAREAVGSTGEVVVATLSKRKRKSNTRVTRMWLALCHRIYG